MGLRPSTSAHAPTRIRTTSQPKPLFDHTGGNSMPFPPTPIQLPHAQRPILHHRRGTYPPQPISNLKRGHPWPPGPRSHPPTGPAPLQSAPPSAPAETPTFTESPPTCLGHHCGHHAPDGWRSCGQESPTPWPRKPPLIRAGVRYLAPLSASSSRPLHSGRLAWHAPTLDAAQSRRILRGFRAPGDDLPSAPLGRPPGTHGENRQPPEAQSCPTPRQKHSREKPIKRLGALRPLLTVLKSLTSEADPTTLVIRHSKPGQRPASTRRSTADDTAASPIKPVDHLINAKPPPDMEPHPLNPQPKVSVDTWAFAQTTRTGQHLAPLAEVVIQRHGLGFAISWPHRAVRTPNPLERPQIQARSVVSGRAACPVFSSCATQRRRKLVNRPHRPATSTAATRPTKTLATTASQTPPPGPIRPLGSSQGTCTRPSQTTITKNPQDAQPQDGACATTGLPFSLRSERARANCATGASHRNRRHSVPRAGSSPAPVPHAGPPDRAAVVRTRTNHAAGCSPSLAIRPRTGSYRHVVYDPSDDRRSARTATMRKRTSPHLRTPGAALHSLSKPTSRRRRNNFRPARTTVGRAWPSPARQAGYRTDTRLQRLSRRGGSPTKRSGSRAGMTKTSMGISLFRPWLHPALARP